MDSIARFPFPAQFTDLLDQTRHSLHYVVSARDPVKGKTVQFLQKNLNNFSQSLAYQPDLLEHSPDRFDFLFYIMNQISNQDINTQLGDLLVSSYSRVEGDKSVSRDLLLFLSLYYLSQQSQPQSQALAESESESEEHDKQTTNKRANNISQNISHNDYTITKLLKLLTKVTPPFTSELLQLFISALLPNLQISHAKNIMFKVVEQLQANEFFSQRKVVQSRLAAWGVANEKNAEQLSDFLLQDGSHVFQWTQFLSEVVQTFLVYGGEKQQASHKPQRAFLIQMTKRKPELFKQESLLHVVASFLDNSNYFVRNSAVMGICNLLIPRVLEEFNEKELLRCLLARLTDVHAHSRVQSLSTLEDLLNHEHSLIVRSATLQELVNSVVERLKDKSPLVRKTALQVLQTLVMHYYKLFNTGGKFWSISNVKVQYDTLLKEKKKLDILCADIEQTLQPQDNCKIEIELFNDEIDKLKPKLQDIKEQIEKVREEERDLKQYKEFHEDITTSIELSLRILGSKTYMEVQEAIKLIVKLYQCGFDNMNKQIKSILVLIYSRENSTKILIVETFYDLFLKSSNTEEMAQKLFDLIQQCDMIELNSLEQIMNKIVAQNLVSIQLVDKLVKHIWVLWVNSQYERSYLTILYLLSFCKWRSIPDKLASIYQFFIHLSKTKRVDFIQVVYLTQLLNAFSTYAIAKNQTQIQELLQMTMKLLIDNQGTSDRNWFLACDAILRVVFLNHVKPENACEQFITSLSMFLTQPKKSTRQEFIYETSAPNPEKLIFQFNLAQVLFAAGTMCIKVLVHTDNIKNQLITLHNKRVTAVTNSKDNKNKRAEELEKIQGGEEKLLEEKLQYLEGVIDNLITRSPKMLFFVKISKDICMDLWQDQTGQERNLIVDQVSVLALQQFMCLSGDCTRQNVAILFHLLEARHVAPAIKNNILVSLADNYFRFPNQMEAYINKLMSCLKDKNLSVRRTSLMIISHLILMDLLKTKSDISKIAQLISDPDQKMQIQAKLFFQELNKKDSKALYMLLPDLITQMAEEQTLGDDEFERFAQEVIPLIEKEKITEQLIDKFIERFMLYSQLAQERNEKLNERERLGEEEVMMYNPTCSIYLNKIYFLFIQYQLATKNAHFWQSVYNIFHTICQILERYLQIQKFQKYQLVQGYDHYRRFLTNEFIYDAFKGILQKCKKSSGQQKSQEAKKKQQKSLVNGKEMTPAQEYQSLLNIFEDNLNKFDRNYHLSQLKKPQNKRTTNKQGGTGAAKSRKKVQQQPQIEEEVGEYEIDYTKVYKPTVITRRRQRAMDLEENYEIEKDYEQHFGEKQPTKDKVRPQEKKQKDGDNEPKRKVHHNNDDESGSSLDIEI